MNRWLAVGLGVCLLAAAFLYAATERPRAARSAASRIAPAEGVGVITLGAIAPSAKDEYSRMEALADYLGRRLAPQGIEHASVLVATSFPQMAELMRDGKVDLLIDSPFPIAEMRKLSGAQPFLRRWKKGATEYHSVVFARADGEIRSLSDLRGKMVAFEDPHSTSGYLLPKALFLEAGLEVVEYADPAAAVPSDRVGYVFARSDENTVFWVLRNRVPAGATSNLDVAEKAGDREGELVVLARSVAVPRQMVAHRPGLAPDVVAAVAEVMTGMDGDEEGRRALQEFDKTTKFDRLPEETETALRKVAEYTGLIAADLPR